MSRSAQRQRQREGGAAADRRGDLDRPAVRLGDRARDEEAETRARLRPCAGRLGTAELLEDQPLLLDRHARSAVANLDAKRFVLGEDGHNDRLAYGGVLDGVVDQICHDLTKTLLIAAHGRQRAVDLRTNRYL